jgi:hypothetical protein
LQAALFSSIVALFIIEIYKTLLPSNGQSAADNPPSNLLRINTLLFLSFFLSVMSAVGCTLIQQWCENYKKFAYPKAAPHTRGRVRTYLFRGLEAFQMRRFVYGIHVLLHCSLFLFFWGLSDFFYTVNHKFGTVIRQSLVGPLIIYLLYSILPLIYPNSPYDTPMTHPMHAAAIILRIILRTPWWFPRWIRRQPFHITGLQYYQGIHFDRARLCAIEASKQAERLEPYAMQWLFTDNNLSDSDMDKFLEALPGYVSSSHTEKGRLDEYLTAEYILSRIKEHFITCATSVELSDEARISRVSSCVKALMLIFQYIHKCKDGYSDSYKLERKILLQQNYIQALIDGFKTLCGTDDDDTALRASCISALAVQGFLSDLISFNSGMTDSSRFPVSLIPIYNYLFPHDDTVTISWFRDHPTSDMKMRMGLLLHNGPLANLTKLAQAIRDRDHVPPSILSFCWKILDILLTQLRTIHSDEPTRAQIDFDDLHENTRKYVYDHEMGFRMTPLLEVLDTVARGLRILMVFLGHPKYYRRADVVFGKEYLRNCDFLEAFAHCLPSFIANHSPELCRHLMEKLVIYDDLWTNLQVNLWNTQRSDSPIPDKLRVFEDFCTVLDIAFSVLEDSQDVDWLAPEFGSLSNNFESFITHCFQGAFMGRATSFRVGTIKARFCRALLSQFKDDMDREGTVSFQSQWDVASLARLIGILGLQDKENPDFWDFYVNGGQIGTNFTAKALEMIDIAARDGPLLIFCHLGRLVVTAVPLQRSGLELNYVEKVLGLQMKVVKDKRLPLMHASDIVWEELGQLRDLVNDKRTGEDRNLTGCLLRIIDDVFHLRSSGSMDAGQSEPAEQQRSFRVGSDATAVQSSDITTSEGEVGFGRACSLLISRATTDLRPESSPQSTVQVTAGTGIVHRSFGTFLSTIPSVIPDPHFQFMDTSQRRICTPMMRSISASGAAMPTLATRASASALFEPPRDAPTILQGHARTSSRRSSEHIELATRTD